MTITPAPAPATGIPAWREQQARLDVLSSYRRHRGAACYPARAMQTVRDDLAYAIARHVLAGRSVPPAIMDQFAVADAWCRTLPQKTAYWWTTRP